LTSISLSRLGESWRATANALPAEGVVIAVLVVSSLLLGAGFLLGRYRQNRYHGQDFQNRGEALVRQELKERFGPPDYHLLNHITLPLGSGTTQIDHILVSRFGVFVIETKHYSGWLFASADARNWTKVMYGARFRFQNPIRQNAVHAQAVRGVLDFLPPDAIRPVVVFTGSAEFRTAIPSGVFKLADFLAFIASQSTEVVSINRLQFCVGRLEMARLSITKATDVEHVAWVRSRYGDSD
jgi:hypothetical protein